MTPNSIVMLLSIFARTPAHDYTHQSTPTSQAHTPARADPHMSMGEWQRLFQLLVQQPQTNIITLQSCYCRIQSAVIISFHIGCLQLDYRIFVVCWSLVTWLALCSVSRPRSALRFRLSEGSRYDPHFRWEMMVNFISTNLLKHRQSKLQGQDQGQLMIRHHVSYLLLLLSISTYFWNWRSEFA